MTAFLSALLVWGVALAGPVEEAKRLIRVGDYDRAIKALRDFLSRHPRDKTALTWLGYAYEVKGERELAADAYAKAIQAGAGEEARRGLRRIFSGKFPRWLTETARRSIPLPHTALSLKFDDPLLPEGAPKKVEVLYTRGLTYTEKVPLPDPRGREKFNRILYGYVKRGEKWHLRAAVVYKSRYLSESERDYFGLAVRAMEAILRLMAIGLVYLDRGPEWAGKELVKVWLCEGGDGGAEQWGENIFVYSVSKENHPCERLRQLAHEYGHLLLPGIDEFEKPEKWADGHLGEALFMWLGAKNSTLWPKESAPFLPSAEELAEYAKARYVPVAGAFLNAGPQSPLLFDRTERGMWYLAGFLLFATRGLSPSPVRRFLKEFSGVSPYDVMLQMSRVAWECGRKGIMVRAGWRADLGGSDPDLPLLPSPGEEIRLWAPLDAGDYVATLVGKGEVRAILRLRGPSNRELSVKTGSLSARFSLPRGWYEAILKVRVSSKGATIEGIKFLPAHS